jgi:hypothetical protein
VTTPEGYEKREVDAFLKKLGPDLCWSFKPYMAGFGKSGVPDYCLCLAGAFWALEIKRPGKEPTVLQDRRIREIRQAGGYAAAGTAEVVIQAMTDWLAARGIVA